MISSAAIFNRAFRSKSKSGKHPKILRDKLLSEVFDQRKILQLRFLPSIFSAITEKGQLSGSLSPIPLA
jgi:hypothetical protein